MSKVELFLLKFIKISDILSFNNTKHHSEGKWKKVRKLEN